MNNSGATRNRTSNTQDNSYFISDCLNSLTRTIKKIEAEGPLEEIKTETDKHLDRLVVMAGQNRDIKLLARIQTVKTILNTVNSVSEKKEQLISELSKICGSLQNILKFLETVQQQAPTEVTTEQTQTLEPDSELEQESSFFENPAQKNKEIVLNKVLELQEINNRILDDIESITSENDALFKHSKEMRDHYATLSEKYDKITGEYKILKNNSASTQIEYNRILMNVDFLKKEREKFLGIIEAKYASLDQMVRRLDLLKRNFDFTRGEANVSEDLLLYTDGLLKNAYKQKKTIKEKTVASGAYLDTLLSELAEVIKKGKMLYYENI